MRVVRQMEDLVEEKCELAAEVGTIAPPSHAHTHTQNQMQSHTYTQLLTMQVAGFA